MTADRKTEVMNAAIRGFGEVMQVIVAIEEMSELQKALTKWLRAVNSAEGIGKMDEILAGIAEEMADVGIMMQQMRLIFGDPQEAETEKLERLERKLISEGML